MLLQTLLQPWPVPTVKPATQYPQLIQTSVTLAYYKLTSAIQQIPQQVFILSLVLQTPHSIWSNATPLQCDRIGTKPDHNTAELDVNRDMGHVAIGDVCLTAQVVRIYSCSRQTCCQDRR